MRTRDLFSKGISYFLAGSLAFGIYSAEAEEVKIKNGLGERTEKVLERTRESEWNREYTERWLNDFEQITPAENVVVIVHGWQSNPSVWADQMVEDINSHFSPSVDPSNWKVGSIHWEDAANVLSPFTARANAVELGNFLGNRYTSAASIKFFHFIGHSAGCWIGHSAAKRIHEGYPHEVETHLTNLDAFTPSLTWTDLGDSEFIGFAEHYYVEDSTPYTNSNLTHAHNVELNYIILHPIVAGHDYPYIWYNESITNPTYAMGQIGYGFVRSWEGGGRENFEFGKDNLPRGNSLPQTQGLFMGFLDLSENIVGTSDDGTITSNEEGIKLSNVNAENRNLEGAVSGVWIESFLEVPRDSEYIRFNYKFLNGDGILTARINGEDYLISDKMNHGTDIEDSERIYLDKGGENILSLRLDMVDDSTPGEVFIYSPEYGRIEMENSAKYWTRFK